MPITTAFLYLQTFVNDLSCEDQKRELETFCQRQGWSVGRVYTDHDLFSTEYDSATKIKLLQDAWSGEVGGVVVCWKVGRLTSSTSDILHLLVELKSAGIDFCSVAQNINTASADTTWLTLLNAVVKAENHMIGERVRASLRLARSRGVKLGRPRVHFSIRRMIEMKEAGYSWSQISRVMGVSSATLRRVKKDAVQDEFSSKAKVVRGPSVDFFASLEMGAAVKKKLA